MSVKHQLIRYQPFHNADKMRSMNELMKSIAHLASKISNWPYQGNETFILRIRIDEIPIPVAGPAFSENENE